MAPRRADIILTRNDGFTSRLIRRFNAEDGEPALVSHAGLFVGEDLVLEALWRGVVTSEFPSAFSGSEYVVFSPRNVSVYVRRLIVHRALQFSARRYGFVKIFGQYLDWLFNTDLFTSKVFTSERYPYCSFIVAEAYALAGLDFGVPTKSTTPDDILDFVIRNPDKYGLVEGTPRLIKDIEQTYGVAL